MASKSRQAILTRGAHQLLSLGVNPLASLTSGGGAKVEVGSGGDREILQIQREIPQLQGIKLLDRQPNGQSRIGKLERIINRPR